ncbi:glycoside hydrolase family 3 N-terminal domain-containing protein [Flavivirga algicola]|uniref:beta-glucosidase n=1 Tax=Flavivirga algicola TaxID=2729136 RepID=A0ABX1RWK7_9FLAO|nr:glycoside hydrolase family 3 N-terminal domain-containing protein [Flavivirga algicola]NMH86812.1 hypothetical protein [Flavivirga algicola]
MSINIFGQKADLTIENNITTLIKKMTLEEKIGQLSQPVLDEHTKEVGEKIAAGEVGSFCSFNKRHYTPSERNRLQKIAVEKSRLGIPILFTYDVIHGFSTIYPISLGLSASWDLDLAKDVASMAAKEARYYGIDMTFSPMVDVSRDPRWGRISECYGEDVLLNAAFGKATVLGYQGDDLSSHENIGSCVKHFVGYGLSMGGRDKQFTEISKNTLLNTYLPPFKSAVDAGAVSVMTAFNDISGVPASANRFTMQEVLKEQWGFDGFTLSDWDAVLELKNHGISGNDKESAEKAINAGLDMEMRSDTFKNLITSVKVGKVKIAVIDEAVRRVLRIKYRLGLFDNPYIDDKKSDKVQLTQANRELARKAGAESMVLLKNNGILPLSKNMRRLIVEGPFVNSKDMLGWWIGNADDNNVVTVEEGIRNKTDSKLEIIHGSLARNYDKTVLICLGESGGNFGESNCITDVTIPKSQIELVKEAKAKGKKVVVVIFNGRPWVLTPIMDYADAILIAWHPGTEAGNAVADVLFGDVNPSGKLTCSFPKTNGQIPVFYSDRISGRPRENKYKNIDANPLFEFGFGLSYTSFKYSNLKLSSNTLGKERTITVSVDVTNTGKREGKEIVQLYIHDKVASITRPKKELVKFSKLTIKAGATQTVTFKISASDFEFYNLDNKYTTEAGAYDLWVGGSSDCELSLKFTLED